MLTLLAACERPASSREPAPDPSAAPDVAEIRISRVDDVTPPFRFAKPAVAITDPAVVSELLAALDLTQPATDDGPRCLTAFTADLVAPDGHTRTLDLFCAAGAAQTVPVIRDRAAGHTWMAADPAATQAVLERLGN